MNHARLIYAALLVAACARPSPTFDADTDSNPKAETIRMGDLDVTIARDRPSNRLSKPEYLPDWAFVYPGSRLESKVAQRRDGVLVGRGVSYVSSDDYQKVLAAYERFYREKGLQPISASKGPYGATFAFSSPPLGTYQDMVTLEKAFRNFDTGVHVVNINIAIAVNPQSR